MNQNLLFDLDDTLVYCNKYFHDVLDQFADVMSDWFRSAGVSRAGIMDKHTEIDIAGVQRLGFQSDHFPQSFVDTYRFLSDLTGRTTAPQEIDLLWKLGMSVFDQEIEAYPHMEETLESLVRSGNQLFLYTGGDTAIQQRKIDRMKLQRFFEDRIYVRMHKNTSALEGILQQTGLDRSMTWMIGNSVRTDVVPALQCGIHAVYLKQEGEWKYNVVPIEATPQGALLTLTQLAQVPPAIQNDLKESENK
jgi:putative hydrolase of the HAD superfamily